MNAFPVTVTREIATYISIVLVTILFAGCATQATTPDWRQAYRNCSDSKQSYFRGIPIASSREHAVAENFAPHDTANCAIYVIANWSSGPKSAHASIFLYRAGTEPPVLPPDYWPLFGLNTLAHPRWSDRFLLETSQEFPEFRKAEIFARDVYAMWELPPGYYILDASNFIFSPFTRVVVSCVAGHTNYWAFTINPFLSGRKGELSELEELEGMALVRFRLRSAGKQPGGPFSKGWIGNKECLEEK